MVATTHEGINVVLRVDPQSHRVTHVELSTQVAPELWKSRKPSTHDEPIQRLSVPPMPRIGEMIELLQYLESVSSFWLGCNKIGWGDPKFEWVAESEEEQAALDLTALNITRDYPRFRGHATAEVLDYLLSSRGQLAPVVIALSFFREGMNEHLQHRYLYSFMNFFFFLEDLYGSGKTKNRAVAQAFQASSELRRHVEYALKEMAKPKSAAQRAALQALAEDRGCDLTTDGVLRMIVLLRGSLHHFSSKSALKKGHPLNQHELQPLSALILGICLAAVADLMPAGQPPMQVWGDEPGKRV